MNRSHRTPGARRVAAAGLSLTILLASAPARALDLKTWVGAGAGGGGAVFNTASNWNPPGTPGASDSCVMIVTSAGTSATSTIITVAADVTVGALHAAVNAEAVVFRLDAQANTLTVLGPLNGEANAASPLTQMQFSVGTGPGSAGAVVVGGPASFGVNGLQQTFCRGVTGSNSRFVFRGDVTFGLQGVTSGSNFPGRYVFDGTGVQVLRVDNLLLSTVGLSSVDVGGAGSPTVVLAGATSPFLNSSATTANLTVNAGSTLDLGDLTLNRDAAGGVLTLGPGATLRLGAGSGGRPGSNFPTNFTAHALDASSTVDYDAPGGVSQTVYAPPVYGNLALTNGSAAGATTKSATAALTLAGDLAIGPAATFAAGTSLTHRVGGSWVNDGTFAYTTASTIEFNTAGSRTVRGASVTGFDRVTVNKGAGPGNTLEVLSPITLSAAAGAPTLALVNGTFKLSSPSALTPFGGAVTIPATAGLTLDHPGATCGWGAAGPLVVNGRLAVANGTMSVGQGADRLEIGGAGALAQSGGALIVNGRLQATAAGGSVAVDGGAIEIPPGGGVNSASASIFDVRGAAFAMTGGVVRIASRNADPTLPDVRVGAGAAVTGGTFVITSGAVAQRISLDAAAPLHGVRVESGPAPVTAELRTTLRVADDLVLVSGTLDAATRDANVEVGGDWVNDGAFLQGAATVSFVGAAEQRIGGAVETVFHDLAVRGPGGVELDASTEVGGTLRLEDGSFSIGAHRLTLRGPIAGNPDLLRSTLASSLLVTGAGPSVPLPASVTELARLTVGRPGAEAVVLGASLAVGAALELLQGNLSTGTHTLSLATGAVLTRGSGHVIGRLAKSVPPGAPGPIVFEVGTTDAYSPIEAAFANVTAGGRLTASAVAGFHPDHATSGLDPGRTVGRHYRLEGEEIGFDECAATFHFVPADLGAGADPANFVVRRFAEAAWSATGAGARTPTSTQATGLAALGGFAIGELRVHTITATAGPDGAIAPAGAVPVTHGEDRMFAITPDPGFEIEDVRVDGVSVGPVAAYTFVAVAADHTIHATFGRFHTLTVTTVGDGSVTRNPDQPTYAAGAEVELTAHPGAGWAFGGWSGDASGTDNPLTLTVTGDLAVVATFDDVTPPTARLLAPNGGETFAVGGDVVIEWSASDNDSVASVDLLLSRSGADGPFEPIAVGIANSGRHDWTVTGPPTAEAIVKLVARDRAANAAEDASDAPFAIAPPTAVTAPPPVAFALSLAPNPTVGPARIAYSLPRAGGARLRITDVQGRTVATLADGAHDAGRHERVWNVSGAGPVSPGVFFARLEWSGQAIVRRMVVAR